MSCCPIVWRLVARSVAVSALISLFSLGMIPLSAADLAPWADVAESEEQSLALGVAAERPIVPQRYRTVRLDWAALGGILPLAPRERTPAARSVETVLNLPLPDGTFGRFRIEDSPMMDASLAAALPDVKTYRGFGLDDPSAFARFDTTPAGFHAMIRSNSATIFIDPYARGERDVYIVYDKRDFVVPESERPVCLVDSSEGALLPPILPVAKSAAMPVAAATNGATFRQINLAVAATGEYTTFHGGTVPLAQAAIVTTINRVNVVYEHDLAIRMNLVDNSTVVFTNSATDPYSNVCSVGELGVNQTTLDTNIGATFYDLGHVMGGPGGGGGRAGVGPCLQGIPGGNLHARGCTGLDTPIGDPFDIDFVAHEIGHQWGAPHTFNGTVGNCAGNRVSSAAYEPGSGSTIMAYAGICGSDNLQSNSDDYFHGSSLGP